MSIGSAWLTQESCSTLDYFFLKDPTSVATTGNPKLYAKKSTPLWKISL